MELPCAGTLKGMRIKLQRDMIAHVAFDAKEGCIVLQLKEGQSAELFCNHALVGVTPCGARVLVEGKQALLHQLRSETADSPSA